MGRRSPVWLAVAALLLGLAAWLMGVDDVPQAVTPPKVAFPRPGKEAFDRAQKRLRPLPTRTATSDGGVERVEVTQVNRDPLLAALPPSRDTSVMVLEASALRHSPIGEMLLSCLDGAQWDQLDEFRETTGVDPLADIDRLGIAGDTVVMSGHFENADWDAMFSGGDEFAYGDQGRIFVTPEDADSGTEPSYVGVWNDEVIVMGGSREDVEQALDRIEGRAAYEEPPLHEYDTYGDVYGVLTAQSIARMMGGGGKQSGLRNELKKTATRVVFNIDLRNDFALTASVEGPDSGRMNDLARALGGALSAGRLEAQRQDQTALADFLDYARVIPSEGKTFGVELALPRAFLEDHLGSCKWMPARRGSGEAAPTEGEPAESDAE